MLPILHLQEYNILDITFCLYTPVPLAPGDRSNRGLEHEPVRGQCPPEYMNGSSQRLFDKNPSTCLTTARQTKLARHRLV